jgi:hypothetical protein
VDNSPFSFSLTGIVPAACDAEAGEARRLVSDASISAHSQAPSSLRWFQQEVRTVIDHDVNT